MSMPVRRREFLKTAGAAGAFMIAAGSTARTYAQNSVVQVACIGTGGQGSFHLRDGLTGTPNLQIIAVADVFLPHQKTGTLYAQISNAKVALKAGQGFKTLSAATQQRVLAAKRPDAYLDYGLMLAELGDQIDAVVIATPLDTHFPITMACLDANKYVFCEKTMVRSVEEGRAVVEKCHEKGKFVQVGHQRRYNPKYNLAMDQVYGEKPLLGRITHVTAQWHRNTNWRRNWQEEYPDYVLSDEEKKFIPDLERHLNWRMYADHSGGLFTELATHQTDVANWFLKAVPSRVYAMGGLDYWRDGREVDDNIALAYEYIEKPGMPGFTQVDARSMLQDITRINKSYTVRFLYSSILANQKLGASELIQGDHGTLQLSEEECTMFLEPVGDATPKPSATASAGKNPAPAKKKPDGTSSITSGDSLDPTLMRALLKGKKLLDNCTLETPDVYQFRAFADHILNGGKPRTNEMVGLTTSIGALAAIQSHKENRPVDIDPAWYTFDFETPSFIEHGFNYADYNCPKPTKKKA